MQKVKLVDAIAHLRRELYEANKVGKEEELKLDVEAVEVEFAVEIVKHGEMGGEISFDVYFVDAKLKAGGEIGSTYAHRIKLHLKPTINKQSLQIGGQTLPQKD